MLDQPATITCPRPIIEKIIIATCTYFNCTEIELTSKATTSEVVYRRKLVIALARQHTNMSYKRIANRMGLNSHDWMRSIIAEIESGKDIYRQISDDLKNVMNIVGTLV